MGPDLGSSLFTSIPILFGKNTVKLDIFDEICRQPICIPAYNELTLRPPSTTVVPYANSLDPDETQSNSASHPDLNCLTMRHGFARSVRLRIGLGTFQAICY